MYNTVGSGEGQGQRHPWPNTLHAAGSIVSVVLIDISYVVQGVRTRVVAAIVCTTECVHALRVARTVPLVALHTLLAHCLRHTSRCGHTTSLSAPSLLFPGQRDWSAVPGFLSDVSRHKICGQAHSDIGDVEIGYLATSFDLTGLDCSGCFWLLFQVVLDFRELSGLFLLVCSCLVLCV